MIDLTVQTRFFLDVFVFFSSWTRYVDLVYLSSARVFLQ